MKDNSKKIDERLSGYFKSHLHAPPAIDMKKLEQRNSKSKIDLKKLVAITCALIFCGMSIMAGAKAISMFALSNNAAVIQALEYDYVQNVNTEYITNGDVSVKIDSIMMDQSNLAVVINYKFNKKVDFDQIVLPDFSVEDEQKNPLIVPHFSGIENNKIFPRYDGFSGNDISVYSRMTALGYDSKYGIEGGNIIKQAMFFYGNHYPKNKKLRIRFSEIQLLSLGAELDSAAYAQEEKDVFLTMQGDCSKIASKTTFTGDWKYEMDVSDQMINNENVGFTADQNDYFEINNVTLSPMGFAFEISSKSKVYDEQQETLIDQYSISSIKLMDSNGKEYDLGLHKRFNDKHSYIFNVSSFNGKNQYKLFVEADCYNPNEMRYNGKKIATVIEVK